MLPYVGNGGGSALHRLGMRKVALSRTPPPGARSRSGPEALAPTSNGTHTAAAAVTTSRVAAWVQAVDAPPPTLIPRVPELDLSPARMQRPDTVDGAGSPGRKGTALLVPPTSASKLDPYGKLKYLQKLGAQRNGAADGHSTPAVTPSPAATTADASYLLTPRRGRSLLLNAAQRESLMSDRPVDDVLSALLPAATSGALTPRRTATPQRPSVLTHETALPVATAKVESSQSQTATSRNGDNTQQTPLDVNASRKLDAQQTDGRERLHRDEAAARGALVSAFQVGCRERAAWRALFEVTGRSERQAMMAAEASLRSRIDREWYAAVRGLFTLLVFAESTALLGDFSAKIDAAVATVTELVLEARRTAPTKTATVVSPVKHVDESQPLPAARSTSVEESPAAMSASEATESRRSATPRDADGSPTPSPSRKSYVAHEERITSLPSIAKEMKKAFAPVGGNNIGREVFTNHARRLVHPLLEAMTRAVLTDVVESAVRARLQPEQL